MVGSCLTIEGRSQHLSLLDQAKLQTISNIWSWNYGGGREEKKRMKKKKSKRGNGVVVFDTPYPDSPENKHAKTADCSAAVAYQMEREDPLAVAGVSTASWLNDAMV